jgi:hypothetical protein
MADGTLSPNLRELEDGEVIDITELTPEDCVGSSFPVVCQSNSL